jgi:hypothetical protein
MALLKLLSLTLNLFIFLIQSRNGVFIGIIWKVIYFKGV